MLRKLTNDPRAMLIVTCLLWGVNAIVSKVAAGQISPMSLVCLRWLCVCIALGALLRRDLKFYAPQLQNKRAIILALGVFGLTGFSSLFYIAAYTTSGVNMSLIQASIPAFVLLGGAIFFHERVTPLQLLGLALAISGVAIIASAGDLTNLLTLKLRSGDILLVVASILYAGYALGLRYRPKVPPLVFFTALAFAAFLSSLPLLAMEIFMGRFFMPTLYGCGLLLFVALGPSLIAQMLFLRAVEAIGPARAGLFTNLTPVFGALMAVAFLRESFYFYHGAALALTLGGIFLGERGARV